MFVCTCFRCACYSKDVFGVGVGVGVGGLGCVNVRVHLLSLLMLREESLRGWGWGWGGCCSAGLVLLFVRVDEHVDILTVCFCSQILVVFCMRVFLLISMLRSSDLFATNFPPQISPVMSSVLKMPRG